MALFAIEVTLSVPAFADSYQDALQEGDRLFKAEKIDEAMQAFACAAEAQDPRIAKVACAFMGLCYDRKGDRDQTIAWYERALEKDARYVWALERLTSVYFARQKDYPKGMKLAERAEALYSRDPSVYFNMACCHALAGKAEAAFRYIDKAIYYGWTDMAHLSADPDFEYVRNIEPFKSFFTKLDSIAAGNSQRDQGKQKSEAGANGEALQLYRSALDRFQEVLGTESLTGAGVLNALGLVSSGAGHVDASIDYFEQALEIRLKLLGPENPDVATNYNNLGVTNKSKGEYDRAIHYYEKALAIRLKVLGAEHREVADSYKNLGNSYESKGEYDRAIGYHEKALAIRSKMLGAEHPDVAACFNSLGLAYHSKGGYDKAIGYYEKALAIRLKVLGATHPEVAQCYNNLGGASHSKGEYDRAIGYYEKARAILLKELGAEHPNVAFCYNNLGGSYDFKGEHDRAIGYYEKALAIRLKVLGVAHPDVATSYNNLGGACFFKGEYDRAIGYYILARDLAAKTGNRLISIGTATNLGLLDLDRRHYPEAKKAFLEGIAVIEQARGETGAGKAEFTARNLFLYYLSLQASAAMNDMAGVFDAAEAMRARGFLDRLSLSAALSVEGVLADVRLKILSLNDELESLALQRSAEIQKPESKQDKQRLLSIVNELQGKENEFADLDQSLMRNSRYKELRKPSLASLKDAQQLLAENQAILEYVLWEQEKRQQAWCLVIRKSGAELVALDNSFSFSTTVTDYREAILNGTGAREKLGAQLYEKLIASVEGKLSGVGKLIIVPDGVLGFLPFDALRKDESSPYLTERYQVSLAPSVSVLRMVGGREYGSRAGRWLALGGARYSGESSQVERGRRSAAVEKKLGEKTRQYYATRGAGGYYDALGIQWDDLPGTREEVLAVQQTVYGGKGTRVVLGEQASEKLVKQLSGSGELSQQRVVHFACHGRYDAEYPAYSAVVLSEVSGALKDSSVEDGYLNVEEVALLRLKAEMVELSACETGLGKVVKGDGVIGLTRAFLVAGANRVGVTLWVVDDLATKEFMVRVYSLVEKEGMSYGEAMVNVKREFIKSKDYADPYFWSPFVLYGK